MEKLAEYIAFDLEFNTVAEKSPETGKITGYFRAFFDL